MRGADDTLQPLLAGVVASIVGFASTFTVVLAGLRAVGATPAQASSGLLVLCATMGVASILLSVRHRIPISIAWSTPGAALLVSAGASGGGWPEAVGAFVVAGALIALAGTWSLLGRWIAAIPAPIASAMLAGVLLPLCLAPVEAVVRSRDSPHPWWGPGWRSCSSRGGGRFPVRFWPPCWRSRSASGRGSAASLPSSS
jgi:benzoate membrane transport protein